MSNSLLLFLLFVLVVFFPALVTLLLKKIGMKQTWIHICSYLLSLGILIFLPFYTLFMKLTTRIPLEAEKAGELQEIRCGMPFVGLFMGAIYLGIIVIPTQFAWNRILLSIPKKSKNLEQKINEIGKA